MKRPTSITVIGWIFVGFGAFSALGGLFGLAMSLLVGIPGGELQAAPSDMPAPFRFMSYMFDYFWVMAAGQLVVAALMIAGGTALLRLRAWGRTLLEALTWASLAYLVVFGAFWVWAVLSMQTQVPTTTTAPESAFFSIFIAFGIAMIIGFTIPPAVIIRTLRSRTVRDAVSPSRV